MSPKKNNEFFQFVSRFIISPALSQRSVLSAVLLALAFLALTQATALLLIKGFLAAFFADTTKEFIGFDFLLPQRILFLFPQLIGLQMPRESLVWGVPVGILCVGALKAFSSYVYNFGLARIALKVAQNYREIVFESALKLPWLKASARSAGDWMTVIMSDAIFIQTRLTDFSAAFVKDSVLIVSCLLTLAFIHPPAAIVLTLIAPLIAWQMGRAGRRIAWYTEAFQRELGVLAAMLLGIRERFRYMRAQRGEKIESKKFEERNRTYLKMMTGSIFIRALVAPGMEWVGFILFAVFIFGWTRQLPGFVVGPDLVLQFFIALGMILKPVRELGEQVARWSETIGGLRRSMDVVNSVQEAKSLEKTPEQVGENAGHFSDVRIKNITVGYGDRSAVVASDLNLAVGKSIAIVGPSGSGKSTLVRSLSGLVPPESWDANVSWQAIRDNAALVSQSPFLFKDTVRKNLTYGFPDSQKNELGEHALWRVLSVVNLEQFIKALPEGLDTVFSPLDSNFSGGQVQRLVIGRALLRSPRILLLDEATSAIDVSTELDITQRLITDAKENGRILLAITHRLQWLSMYDEIWFVEHGRISDVGSLSELKGKTRFREFLLSGVQA